MVVWTNVGDGGPTPSHHWISVLCSLAYASNTPVRHLYSVVRHTSSVISHPFQSLSFTPICFFCAVDTDFCVPTVLNSYSPGKWLTEALFVGNSLSTAHYHDLWSASVIRRPLKSLPNRFWLTMDDGWRTRCEWSFIFSIRAILTEADDWWLKRTTDGLTDRCEWGISNETHPPGSSWQGTVMLHSHLSVIYIPSSVIRPQSSVVRFSHYYSHLSVFSELWTQISVYRQF